MQRVYHRLFVAVIVCSGILLCMQAVIVTTGHSRLRTATGTLQEKNLVPIGHMSSKHRNTMNTLQERTPVPIGHLSSKYTNGHLSSKHKNTTETLREGNLVPVGDFPSKHRKTVDSLQERTLVPNKHLSLKHRNTTDSLQERNLVPERHLSLKHRNTTDSLQERNLVPNKHLSFKHRNTTDSLQERNLVPNRHLSVKHRNRTDTLQEKTLLPVRDLPAMQAVKRTAITETLHEKIGLPQGHSESKFLMDYENSLHFCRRPPLWQKELYKDVKSRSPPKDKYFLSHLLMVRLYSTDLAKWTLKELKQWMHYMFLIGVEHIYICDHYHQGDGDMEKQLQQYISLGLVSYTRVLTKIAMTAQVECYRKWVLVDGHKSRWMTSVDMDEYPYHMKDKEENFLHRYLRKVEHKQPAVAQVSMPNFLMLGQGDRTKNITIDRIRRSTPGPANRLVKNLFMPEFCLPSIHHCILRGSKHHIHADSNELRMLHYWGSRLQNWGPDTDHVLNMTVPFTDMADTWTGRIRNSLLMFGENDAFSSHTGP